MNALFCIPSIPLLTSVQSLFYFIADQLGQVQTCKNAMKQGTWPTRPTFLRGSGGPRRLDRPYAFWVTLNDGLGWNLAHAKIGGERVKLAKFEPAKTLRNRELGQLCQLFFDGFGRTLTVLFDLEDRFDFYGGVRGKLGESQGTSRVVTVGCFSEDLV